MLLAGCGPPEHGTADHGEAQAADRGEDYLLYAPTDWTQTYLVDSDNQVAHIWRSEYKAGQSAFLQEDGSIVRAGSINDIEPENRFVKAYQEAQNTTFQVGGIVERISKDGDVLWSFTYYSDDFAPHHVATVMPSGNLLMPVWRYFTKEESLAFGRDPKHLSRGGLWIDSIVEVRPTEGNGGDIVWEWRASDHLIQDFDSTKANFGTLADHPERIDINYGKGAPVREDIMHVNSAFYIEELDQIVVTSYHYSELWVIDHSTTTVEAAGSTGGRYGRGGDLLYRWGNPWAYGREDAEVFLLSAVHDPNWLAQDRHLLMYDNNKADKERGLEGGDSRLVEIEPPMAADGSYVLGDDGVYGPEEPILSADLGVQTSTAGTAQRLSDGRTLACNCPKSVALWLEADGTVGAPEDLYENTVKYGGLTQVFRLASYPNDDPGVQAALQ